MGTWIRHFCSQCDYEAIVSGGDDVGMAAATTTIHCYSCKEISDVVTTEEPWLATDKDWVPTDFHCTQSASHRVELWVGQCPKCSNTMEVDLSSTIDWD
jgi:hypothetical protein